MSRLLSLLRAAVSLSILVVLLSRISLEALLARVQGGALAALAAALALVLLMYLLVTLRWRTLAQRFGVALPLPLALRAVFLGLFGGQVLPTTIGGDLVRGWVAARHAGSVRQAAASVVADRLVALFAACVLLALTLPWLGRIALPFAGLLAPAAVLASGALLLGFLLACRVTPAPGPILAAILVAVAIHVIGVIAAAVTAAAYGVDASLGVWFAVMPIAIIAVAVPVSINGWGVREAVIVALAAGHGIAAADALAVSLTLGVLNILASLPGAWLLLSGDAR